jgi:hypothetical protein
MSGFRESRQPQDIGNQRDTNRSLSPSSRNRLQQLRTDAVWLTHLHQGSERIDAQAAMERYPPLHDTNSPRALQRQQIDLFGAAYESVGIMQQRDEIHASIVESAHLMIAREQAHKQKSERFMYSIPRKTLETLRASFTGERVPYPKIRELCNKILFGRGCGDLPYVTHNNLSFEYREAGITVGKEEAQEAAIELVSVLSTINMHRKRTENRSSPYELREQVNGLRDLAFQEDSPQAPRVGES